MRNSGASTLAGAALLAALALGLAACSDDPAPPGPPPPSGDCPALAAAWSLDSIPEHAGSCPVPAAPRELSGESRLAVAVYHFNLQYVAGGLHGFPGLGEVEYSEAELEDLIVRQGLEPVLDLHLAHPSFHADIELQAYSVEVIAQRHPDVLAKLSALTSSGQIALDSFHYSDQLYVAYPREDLERSLDLVEAIFARTCLPLGRAIFTQEGQFARGQLPLAAARGYTVSVLPKNLYRHQLGEDAFAAGVLFADPAAPDHPVLLGGRGFQTADGSFRLDWTFMDDGEVAFTVANLNPYFGDQYRLDPAAIARHEERLLAMEQEGVVHATIAEAAAAMLRRGINPAPLPPILDGTWQPDDTGNLYRWMGDAGLFQRTERDSDVLAAIWRARTEVEHAELQLPQPSPALAAGLRAAQRELFLSQVSDSTGWNPYSVEVEYSLRHAAEATRLAAETLACAGLPGGATSDFVCEAGSGRPLDELGVEVVAPSRAVSAVARRCGDRGLTELVLTIEPSAETEEDADPTEALEREVELRVALAGPELVLQHALEESPRTISLDDYAFEWTGIALPAGWLGLGGGRFVLQELSSGRVAALLSTVEPDRGVVRFKDRTVPRSLRSVRRYYLLEGSTPEEAAALAARLNRPAGR